MTYRILETILTDHIDLMTSKFINFKDCQLLCLALGPYRKLPTWTAVIMFLHQNCQVLNHAGNQIIGSKKADSMIGIE